MMEYSVHVNANPNQGWIASCLPNFDNFTSQFFFSGMAKVSGSLVRDKNNKDKTERERNGKGTHLQGKPVI